MISKSGISLGGRAKPSWLSLSQEDALVVRKIIRPLEIPVQILPPSRWSQINPSAHWSPFASSFLHRQRRAHQDCLDLWKTCPHTKTRKTNKMHLLLQQAWLQRQHWHCCYSLRAIHHRPCLLTAMGLAVGRAFWSTALSVRFHCES